MLLQPSCHVRDADGLLLGWGWIRVVDSGSGWCLAPACCWCMWAKAGICTSVGESYNDLLDILEVPTDL